MDCRDLLMALEIDRAHLVGVSYSAAVALQLAVIAPSLVHTLTISEPPPVHIPNAEEFISANNELMELYQAKGASFALDNFQTRLVAEVRKLILDWLPQAEDVVIEDADHTLVVTHPEQTSQIVADFLKRHPIGD